MPIVDIKKNCLGCAGCIDVCPADALMLSEDKDGFYIPTLNEKKCVYCEKCAAICPVISLTEHDNKPEYYYGWNLDGKIRATSSSGGIFRALADFVLARHGVVYGAKYSADYHSVEMASTDETSIEELQRSKYVQANAAGLYRSIKNHLVAGRTVLLTGTPCQIAATKNVCDKNENLILVDFLCGGVPSPSCYDQYIGWLEKKYKSKVKEVNFRSKKNGWTRSTVEIKFHNGKRYSSRYEFDPYYALFYLTSQTKNAACLECDFTTNRYADITIADFWGFRKADVPNDEKGMSLIVAHTSRGKQILRELDNVHLIPLAKEYGDYDFVPRRIDAAKKNQRKIFFAEVEKNGFIKAAHSGFFKYGRYGVIFKKIKNRAKGLFR